MSRYVYECEKCNKQYEIVKKITDETPELCPECNQEMMRLIQKTSVVYKCDGFTHMDKRRGK